MDAHEQQKSKKTVYAVAVFVFAVGGFVLLATGAPAWIAVACVVIALLVGWVALRAQAPLERMQITYGLVAAVFAIAAVVLYSPGVSAFIAGACILIGLFNFWMALNVKDQTSTA
ncbi:MAG: hypothetical protein V9E98_16260 [Candidatus Nanopelagicales bacterium]|jgi:hypothetical protein